MGTIQTLQEVSRDWAREHAEAVAPAFFDSVRPVYGVNERSTPSPEPIGSCIFLQVGNDRYLVTAAHVVDHTKVTTLYVGAGQELLEIKGDFYATVAPDGERGEDHADFAFMRLGGDVLNRMSDVNFLHHTEVSGNCADSTKRSYLVMGYPVSLNKKISATERVVRPTPWHYQSVGVAPDSKTLKAIGCNLEQHLFLKHDKKVGNYEGDVSTAGKPQGASGGALIDLGVPTPDSLHPEAPRIGRLAGLFIERKSNERLLVFVKIQVILNEIRKKQEAGSSTDVPQT